MLGHLCAVAALLHLAGLVGAQVLSVTVPTVSYESKIIESKANIGEKYYVSSKLTSIALTCRANGTNITSSLVWYRQDGIKLDNKASSTSDLTNPQSVTSTLSINHQVKADFTAYVCSATSGSSTMNGTGSFSTRPLLTITVNGVNEYDSAHWPGETVTLKCIVYGYPTGIPMWIKSTNTSFSYIGAELILPSISYNVDRGYYTCNSSNTVGVNSATVFLRVKDSQSYIAPLVSIFCEIIIIFAIVIAYEFYDKRRRRIADGDLKSD